MAALLVLFFSTVGAANVETSFSLYHLKLVKVKSEANKIIAADVVIVF